MAAAQELTIPGLLYTELLENRLEFFERLGAENALAVNNESRGALHAQLRAGSRIALHLGGILARIQALIEFCSIQAQLCGKTFQVIFAECALVLAILALEQQVVVFPELALVISAFRGFGGPLRFIAQEG
jgi:hypothetical protein